MGLYNIRSIEQMMNLYSRKGDICCYLGYELGRLFMERRLHDFFFLFTNSLIKYLKNLYINQHCTCL